MVAPLDQLRDLLLCPWLPRTPAGKLNRRGEAKGAENPNGTACPSTSSTGKCWTRSPAVLSHVITSATPWPLLCPPSAVEVRRGRGRTQPPPAPHQRAHGGKRKGEGFRHHPQSFPLETRMEGGRRVETCIAGEHPVAPGAEAATGCQGERQVFS